MIVIRIRLMVKIIAVAEVRILILLPLFSETNFEIDIGIARVAIVSKSEYVGVAIVYKLIPYSPIILVYTILIINPSILVKKPLPIRINVDFINKFLSFTD